VLAGTRMSLDFIGPNGDGDCGDNWTYKTCKVPDILSLTTNKPTPNFYKPLKCKMAPHRDHHWFMINAIFMFIWLILYEFLLQLSTSMKTH